MTENEPEWKKHKPGVIYAPEIKEAGEKDRVKEIRRKEFINPENVETKDTGGY